MAAEMASAWMLASDSAATVMEPVVESTMDASIVANVWPSIVLCRQRHGGSDANGRRAAAGGY